MRPRSAVPLLSLFCVRELWMFSHSPKKATRGVPKLPIKYACVCNWTRVSCNGLAFCPGSAAALCGMQSETLTSISSTRMYKSITILFSIPSQSQQPLLYNLNSPSTTRILKMPHLIKHNQPTKIHKAMSFYVTVQGSLLNWGIKYFQFINIQATDI